MDLVNHKTIRTTLKTVALTLFSLFTLVSCQNSTLFQESKTLAKEGWEIDSVSSFDVRVTDVTKPVDIEILTRNSALYPYQNLWLFVNELRPDSTVLTDTVEIYLADNRGRWLGSGMGSLYQLSTPMKVYYHFPDTGNYTFAIQQGMRSQTLKGLTEIGLRVKTSEYVQTPVME